LSIRDRRSSIIRHRRRQTHRSLQEGARVTTHLSSTTEGARADRRASGRRASGQFISQGLMHVVLLAMAVLALAPFVWSIFASFKLFKD